MKCDSEGAVLKIIYVPTNLWKSLCGQRRDEGKRLQDETLIGRVGGILPSCPWMKVEGVLCLPGAGAGKFQ